MGEFGTGKLLARDGVTVMDEPNTIGEEWQVRDSEDMLFQVARAPQYPGKCIIPNVTTTKTRRLGESITRDAAEKACAGWKENKILCIQDVIATGDLDLAAAGPF